MPNTIPGDHHLSTLDTATTIYTNIDGRSISIGIFLSSIVKYCSQATDDSTSGRG